jgi:hypothetical protein
MGTDRQTFLDNLPTVMTFLAGKMRIHPNDLMTSSFSLLFKDVEECSPTSIENALGQVMIFHHVGDLKVFDSNDLILFGILFRRLEMMISALTVDFEVCLRHITGGFPTPVRAFLASAYLTLLAPKGLLRSAIETRVLNGIAIAISKEHLQPDINADVRMLTLPLGMFTMGFGLADDKSIPMSIRTMDKVDGLRGSLESAMQFNLEEVSKLLRDNEVFLVLMQIAIFPVLSQLDRMPPIRRFEPWEANTRDGVLPGNKEPFEGLGEAISKHLYRGGWNMLTLPLEGGFKLVLAWKGSLLLILLLDGLHHPIVNGTRLCQASHEFAGLLCIHTQAILKGPHGSILPEIIRIVKRLPYPGAQATQKERLSPPCLEGRGTQALLRVERGVIPMEAKRIG